MSRLGTALLGIGTGKSSHPRDSIFNEGREGVAESDSMSEAAAKKNSDPNPRIRLLFIA